MSQPEPFYADWTFWSFVVAGIAVVLSQMPPLRTLLRAGRIEVDAHGSINLGHEIGHTNLQFLVALHNRGGREVRIRGLSIELHRSGALVERLPVRTYFETTKEQRSVLFLPFSLRPGEERWHTYWFFQSLETAQDRAIRQIRADVAASIRAKIEMRRQEDPDSKALVEADDDVIARVNRYFEQHYKLVPGEYELVLFVESTKPTTSVTRRYRFTLFESDVQQLNAARDEYKYGFGVCLEAQTPAWVARQISPM